MSTVAVVLFNQLVAMAIYMLLGFLLFRLHVFNEVSARHLTNLQIYVINSALMISCFNLEYTKEGGRQFLIAALMSLCMYGCNIFISYIAKIKGNPVTLPSERFGIIFGNIGFMGTPLTIRLFGTAGGFMNIEIVAGMNVLLFSYGRVLLGEQREKFTFKDICKLFNHPFFYSLALGMLLYFTGIHLPAILQDAVDSVGSMTGVVSMMCCGMYLATGNAFRGFKNPRVCLMVFIRLIAIPMIVLFILKLLHVDRTFGLIFMVAASTPMAAMTIFLSNDVKERLQCSMEMFIVSTLLCIITMPVIVGFASTIL